MRKRLIINADDFGYNREITDGIVHAHRDGLVTSTTLMANMPAAAYACELALQLPALSVGVHFTISQHKPILPPEQVPSLVDEQGGFLPFEETGRRGFRFAFNGKQLEAELEAQARFMIDRAVVPTHWDSHHHACMYPQTHLAATRVARRLGIRKQRIYRNCYFVDRLASDQPALRKRRRKLALKFMPKRTYYILAFWVARGLYGMTTPGRLHHYSRMVTDVSKDDKAKLWRRLVANCPEGTSEVICHPGYEHVDPQDRPQMMAQRVEELAILTDPSLGELLRRERVLLINYREL